ncbi:MAG: extracellular solute-binding protein [Chloroflexi bacterium]|nr:extracellular solute-binding protein [Chloroflexota bacterium]
MKRCFLVGLMLAAVAALLVAGCAPTAAPAPPRPAPTAAPAPVPATAPSLTPEQKAWEDVVAAAKKEGTITVYSYGWRGDIGIAIAKAFQERYGIKVEIITGRGAEFIERLKAEQRSGRMVADLFEGGTPHALNIKKSGLTISSADLLALKDASAFVASPFSPDPDKNVLAYNIFVYSPYVNTNLVKPGEEPKAWKDLLDPKWKGKMLLGNANVSMEVYMQFWPLKAAGVVDLEYLKALGKQDILWTTGLVEDIQKLSRAERPLSIFGTPVDASGPILSGAPIKAIPMEPAMAASDVALTAIKASPHPNATKLLINWMYTPEGQLAHNKARGTSSIIKGAPSFLPPAADVKASRIVMSTPEILDDEAKSFNEKVMVKAWGQ